MTNLFIVASAQLVMFLSLAPLPYGIGPLLGSGLALIAAYAAALAPALPRPAGPTYPRLLRRARRRLLVRVALWLVSPSLAPTGALPGLTLDLPNLRASLALIHHPDQVLALVLTFTTAQTWISPILVLLSLPVALVLLFTDLRGFAGRGADARDRPPSAPALTRLVLTMPDRDASGDPVFAARIAAELARLGIRVTRVETEQEALSARLANTSSRPKTTRPRGLRRTSSSATPLQQAHDQTSAWPDQIAGPELGPEFGPERGSAPGDARGSGPVSAPAQSEDHLPPAQYSLDLDAGFLAAFLPPGKTNPSSRANMSRKHPSPSAQAGEVGPDTTNGQNRPDAADMSAPDSVPRTQP